MSRPPHVLSAIVLLLILAPVAGAQQPREPAAPTPAAPAAPGAVYTPPMEAREVQEQLRVVLRQYPPSLRQVLALDPSLMNRQDYMAAYPALVAFLQQHPEVSHNPGYFFGAASFQQEATPEWHRINALQETLLGIALFSAFVVVISVIYSLLRQAIEYRRWRRQVQIQTDMHTRLVDKLGTSQEMQAYLENSAGRRLMEWPTPAAASSTFGPVTRILWSVQIGVVAGAIGVGLLVTRRSVENGELLGAFEVLGTLGIAIGLGFIVSAAASWLLSMRLGLLDSSTKADA